MAILTARGRTAIERMTWAAVFTPGLNGRWGLPLCFVGPPGCGKTSRQKGLVKAAGMLCEVVISSLRDPTDFLGLPVPTRVKLTAETAVLSADADEEAVLMRYAPPQFAARAALARRAVIVLDEVNTAPPAVQAALLRMVNEGVCGELELPPTVRFLLAMNPPAQAAGGWDIAPALANRLLWVEWPAPEPQGFADYLIDIGAEEEAPANARDVEAAVTAAWPAAWARAAGVMAGFIKAKPDALQRQPPAAGTVAAWPTARTNEMAARVMAGADVWSLTPGEELDLLAGAIGGGAAAELHTWRKNNDLPDPEALLDGKVTFKHDPARLDRTAAVLASCTSMVVRPDCPNRPARAEAMWGIHKGLTDEATDLALSSVVALTKARLVLGSKTAYGVLAKMEVVLTAAGVVPEAR